MKYRKNFIYYLVNLPEWVWVLIYIYLFSMTIIPFLVGGWEYLLSVWYRWQALNVGILAFISSVIALNISRLNADEARHRKFIAAKSFLPEALSELTTYFRCSACLFIEAWPRVNDNTDNCQTPLQVKAPNLPSGYKKVFSHCIEFADSDIGNYLAYILMRLQIHHSRLIELENSFKENSKRVLVSRNIVNYLFNLAELQALVNKIFEFSRSNGPFDDSRLTWDDFKTAYCNLKIDFEIYDDLESFTKNLINKR